MALEKAQNRKTLRLPQHDYAGGVYYITQTTQNRQALFGSLVNGRVRLSPAGQMVHDTWHEIPHLCPCYQSDEFVVMPDHIHGIIRVNHAVEDRSVGVPLRGHPLSLKYTNYRNNRAPTEGRPDIANDSASLFDFMHRFKSLTTARYIHGVSERQWTRFDGKVWQREYYERIVRHDEAELRRIREYIKNNPANANVLRFGELRYIGNRDLLKLRKTAFLASRTAASVGVPLRGHPPSSHMRSASSPASSLRLNARPSASVCNTISRPSACWRAAMTVCFRCPPPNSWSHRSIHQSRQSIRPAPPGATSMPWKAQTRS